MEFEHDKVGDVRGMIVRGIILAESSSHSLDKHSSDKILPKMNNLMKGGVKIEK
jgi:hypothetical protein